MDRLIMVKDFLSKIAQEIPMPSRSRGAKVNVKSDVPSGAASRPQTTTHTPIGVSSILAVKEMQQAMQELARAVMSDTTINISNPATINSKKAFNNFISEQYAGSLEDDKKGTEWKSSNPSTKNDVSELNDVMSSLHHISMGGTEFKPDGIWGPKTDNGLRNILGFAYSLLQLEGDFGLPNNIYSLKQWQDFQNALSGYKIDNNKVLLSPDEKKEKAERITKHLQNIIKLYNSFKQQVISRPEYRPIIEGNRAFDKYTTPQKNTLTPNEIKAIQNPLAVVPNVKYQPPDHKKFFTSIPLSALSSKEAYLKYMTDTVGVNEEQAVSLFNTIKSQIEAM